MKEEAKSAWDGDKSLLEFFGDCGFYDGFDIRASVFVEILSKLGI